MLTEENVRACITVLHAAGALPNNTFIPFHGACYNHYLFTRPSLKHPWNLVQCLIYHFPVYLVESRRVQNIEFMEVGSGQCAMCQELHVMDGPYLLLFCRARLGRILAPEERPVLWVGGLVGGFRVLAWRCSPCSHLAARVVRGLRSPVDRPGAPGHESNGGRRLGRSS